MQFVPFQRHVFRSITMSSQGRCSSCRSVGATWMAQRGPGCWHAYCPGCKRTNQVNSLTPSHRAALRHIERFPSLTVEQRADRLALPNLEEILSDLRALGILSDYNRITRPADPTPEEVASQPPIPKPTSPGTGPRKRTTEPFVLFQVMADGTNHPLPGEFPTRKAAINEARRISHMGGIPDTTGILLGHRDGPCSPSPVASWKNRRFQRA